MATTMHRFLISMADTELAILDATCSRLNMSRAQLLRTLFGDSPNLRQSILHEIDTISTDITNNAIARSNINDLHTGSLPFLPLKK
jgi:hypothetical protein